LINYITLTDYFNLLKAQQNQNKNLITSCLTNVLNFNHPIQAQNKQKPKKKVVGRGGSVITSDQAQKILAEEREAKLAKEAETNLRKKRNEEEKLRKKKEA